MNEPKMPENVTDSCGCVFCDLDLLPEERDGRMMHYISRIGPVEFEWPGWVECTMAMRVTSMHDGLKQKIADGVASWLRATPPNPIRMVMDRAQFDALVQSICDQFTADDFESK